MSGYRKCVCVFGSVSSSQIKRISDGAIIPICEENKDYQEYLAWVAEGNTPEEPEQCPECQQTPSPAKILADALVDKGVITQAEIDAVASENGVVFCDE